MKKLLLLLFVLILHGANAGNLNAFFSYGNFFSPEKGPYVETYLSVLGNSVSFNKNSSGKWQGAVEISITFKQKDEIKNALKYKLLSPEVVDTSQAKPNFIDVQRFLLPNGIYDMELSIADAGAAKHEFTTTQTIVVYFPKDSISISGIELIESYKKSAQQNILSKSGYDIIPYVSNFYPPNFNDLIFYTEIYNTNNILEKGENFLITYFIESFEGKTKLTNYSGFSKQTSGNNVIPLFSNFSIKDLPSGNYNLVVEVRNKENKVLMNRKMFFQRSNPNTMLSKQEITTINVSNSFAEKIINKDTLAEYIRYLYPISTNAELRFAENQLKNGTLNYMQQYFYNFWEKRNSITPEKAWVAYYTQVKIVNTVFATTNKKGYATDRGRVYLQYGIPDVKNIYGTEPNSYPYEIWQYYKLKNSSNKKFVFYNPSLAGNNFMLLHSDATGEINNVDWKLKLVKRNTFTNDIDQEKGVDHYGGNAEDNFKDPH